MGLAGDNKSPNFMVSNVIKSVAEILYMNGILTIEAQIQHTKTIYSWFLKISNFGSVAQLKTLRSNADCMMSTVKHFHGKVWFLTRICTILGAILGQIIRGGTTFLASSTKQDSLRVLSTNTFDGKGFS